MHHAPSGYAGQVLRYLSLLLVVLCIVQQPAARAQTAALTSASIDIAEIGRAHV